MKRILIVNNNMHIGGVQKALVNLLQEIHADYHITLLLFYDGGALRGQIPRDVEVLPAENAFRYWGMTRRDARSFRDRMGRAFWAGATRLLGRKRALRLLYPRQKKWTGYDAAVSFLHSGAQRVFYGGCNEFVLHCTEAKKKVTFLHCDYGKIHANTPDNAAIYRGFDKIAACSEGCRRAFLQKMPELAARTAVVENCQNYPAIRRLAQEKPAAHPEGRLYVVTVARFGKEKGILRAIRAVSGLGEHVCIRFDVIGGGAEYAQAERLIAELGLEDTVFLLGEMENPYGYMQAADVLLLPSYSEAAPMVIGEAACLGTPVLTTETSSAREMVAETGFGWVVENSGSGIREGLSRLLESPELLAEREAFLRTVCFDNDGARKSFMELV